MKLEVDIPAKETILTAGYPVRVARRGERWSERCLGASCKEQGVYVIHHNGTIKYIGKTDGPQMSFGMRLRREFQESASQGKHIFPLLAALSVPPEVFVFVFPAERIRDAVRLDGVKLSDFRRIQIFETVLIQLYEPEFQQHHTKRVARKLKNDLGITDAQVRALLAQVEGKG